MDNNTAIVVAAAIAAVPGIVSAVFSYMATRNAKESKAISVANSEKLDLVKADIHTIEVATNSMKDELVKATAVSARSEGRDEERIAGEQRAASLASAPTVIDVNVVEAVPIEIKKDTPP